MSKILIKVIDKVVFPAATLVVAKVFGIYLATELYNFDWHVKNYSTSGSIFSVRFIFDSAEAALTVNTFSNALMFFVIAAACAVILIRATHLHNTHQNPRIISKLAKANLLGLISDTKGILTDAFVWFTALWIATIVCIYGALNGHSYILLGPIAFIISLILSTALITDLDKEVDYSNAKRVNSK